MSAGNKQGHNLHAFQRVWRRAAVRFWVFGIVSAAVGAVVAALVMLGRPIPHDREAMAVASDHAAPPSGAILESDVETPVRPVYGGNQAVSFPTNDDSARALMETSISCGEAQATFFDFLSMRSLMYRPKLSISYRITVEGRDFGTVVSLHERPVGQHGRRLPGIPEETIYSYLLENGGPVLFEVTPADTMVSEPLYFMRSHRDAVCNGMVRFGLLRLPRMGEPWPEQPSFEEKNAKLQSLLVKAPRQTPAPIITAPLEPQPAEAISDGTQYFADQDGQASARNGTTETAKSETEDANKQGDYVN